MIALSRRRAVGVEAAPPRSAEADDDRASLACVCAVSAAGLVLGLVAAFGPAGSDEAVAMMLAAALGGAATVGLGFGLAAVLGR
ncbi:hypothetical protein [Inquilinus sp.]|uniref:hypothetical protein n=1 Tax=Inquilinus sp. TaxID=1932117 RepID=UPI003783906E